MTGYYGPLTISAEEDGMAAEIDMHDVTVRIPVHLTAGETAGFIQRAVTQAMTDNGWSGGAFVIFRVGDRLVSFEEGGFTDPYVGVAPHA